MSKITKTLFGGVVAIALVVGVAVPSASALTQAEATAIITALGLSGDSAAVINALVTGGSSSTGGSYNFQTNLTLGSTGADVTSLQNFLVDRGFLTIPVGVSTGYFGGLTQAALAKYQLSAGISPASGYFGPITRGHVNSLSSPTTGGDDSDDDSSSDDDISTNGVEGDFNDFSVLGSPSNEEVDEDDSEEVFAFEFDAQDSDLRVERVDFIFEANGDSTGSQDDANAEPWDFFEEVTLKRDGKAIKTVSADSSKDWSEESTANIDGESDDDTYRIRFSGLKNIVREGETSEWTLEVTTQSLDDSDLPQSFDVALDTNGIRAVDGAGIDQFVGTGSAANSKSFEITTIDAASVTVTSGDGESMDESRVVETNDTGSTGATNVEVLSFDVEVEDQDVQIKDLAISLGTLSGSTGSLTDIVKKVHLYQGSTKIQSETPSDDDSYEVITFSDIDIDLSEGDESFTIEVDVHDLDGVNFVEGDGIVASTTVASWDVEDTENNDITVSGSAVAENVAFYSEGIKVEFVSASESKTFAADTAGQNDKVKFTIKFKVTAFGGSDVFIDGDVVATTTPTADGTDGLAWSTTSDSTTGTTTVSSILTASGSENGDRTTSGNKSFQVQGGDSRDFTLTTTLEAGIDGVAATYISGILWATGTSAPADTAHDQVYTFGLDDFETDLADLFSI